MSTCRAFPARRALRLEEDQHSDGQYSRLPARPAALDHQRRFHQSTRRLPVSWTHHWSMKRVLALPFFEHLPSVASQGARSVQSWLPGGLRCVERGGGVRVSRAASHSAVQPAGAVPQPGLPFPVPALPAAGCQHGGCLWQVATEANLIASSHSFLPAMSGRNFCTIEPKFLHLNVFWICFSLHCWKVSCVLRVNLAKGLSALQGFITLDPVALASFCESTQLKHFDALPPDHERSVWLTSSFGLPQCISQR